MNMYKNSDLGSNQSGLSLVFVMLLFIALTVVGIAVMRSGILSQKQAVNIQERSVSFHIAQSSNNAVAQSYSDPTFRTTFNTNVVDPAPNTNDIPTLLTHTTSYTTCVGEKGVIGDCADNPKLDGARMVGNTASFYRGCSAGGFSCPGMSSGIGSQNTLGCSFFEHDGRGFVDSNNDNALDDSETETRINQWSQTVQACEYSIE